VGDRPGSRSTHGICQFALSWHVQRGHANDVGLEDLAVVMAGWYDDDAPNSPWSVSLFVDDRADAAQSAALVDIFLGRAGGGTLEHFAAAIGTVHQVRSARITLTHEPRRWSFRADHYVSVSATRPVDAPGPVACGIPGLDRPGQEVISDELRVDDEPLQWELYERCGFATDFDHASAHAG
jgi:hypothetical protein